MKEEMGAELLDVEWVTLILEARSIGLSIQEVQDFLNKKKKGMIKKAFTHFANRKI